MRIVATMLPKVNEKKKIFFGHKPLTSYGKTV